MDLKVCQFPGLTLDAAAKASLCDIVAITQLPTVIQTEAQDGGIRRRAEL